MAEAQSYDEFMSEIQSIENREKWNKKTKSNNCKKLRGGNILSITNKLTKGNLQIVDGFDFVSQIERERTFGDTPVKLRLQEKLKKLNAYI
jgi:exosome complex RNA-binding protein Rrp4